MPKKKKKKNLKNTKSTGKNFDLTTDSLSKKFKTSLNLNLLPKFYSNNEP